MSEGFFDRWSRRKRQARADEAAVAPTGMKLTAVIADEAKPSTPVPAKRAPVSCDAGGAAAPSGTGMEPGAAQTPLVPCEEKGLDRRAEAPEPPPLTLEDVRALRPGADFRPFVAQAVAPEVRNAAFRKLFADPHFNQMDGLDIYIDDYSKPSPLPAGALRRMAGAKFLKLFDEAPDTAAAGDNAARGDAPDPLGAPPASPKPDDHDTDLRLQPDDAPRREDARGGAD